MTPSVYWLLISPLNFSFITSFKLEREYLCRFIVIQYVCINMIILNDTSVVVKALFHLCVCLSSCVVFISFFYSFYDTFNWFIHMTLFKYWNTVCLRASYRSCVSSFAQSLFFLYLSHTLTSVYSFTAVNRVSDRIVFAFIIVCNTSAFFRFLWGELYTRTSTNTHTSTFKILFTRSCHILHCTFYKLFVSLPSSPLSLPVCMYVCMCESVVYCMPCTNYSCAR